MTQPNKPSKTMSSRLLTMKFMQRAAATPSSSPSTPPEPPSKKRRLSNGSYNSTPSSTARSDVEAVEVALAAEEQKRTEALERKAAEMGDTKWYLSFKAPQSPAAQSPLRIVPAGYSTLDALAASKDGSSENEDDLLTLPQIEGRRSFGKFNRAIEKQQNPDLSSDSGSDSEDLEDDDEEVDDSDDPTGAKALIAQSRREAGDKARTERRAKRKAEKVDALRMAEERRKKQVKLNKLTSISGSGGAGGSSKLSTRLPSTQEMTCFDCGKTGHMKRDCPQPSQQRSRDR